MRSQILNTCSLGALLTTCHTTRSVTPSPQVLPARHTRRNTRPSLTPVHEPEIDGTFDPIRNGDCSNVPGLANQIDDCPVILTPLKMSNLIALESVRVRNLP